MLLTGYIGLDLLALEGGAVAGGGGKNRFGDDRPAAGAGAGAGTGAGEGFDGPVGVDEPAGLELGPPSHETWDGVTGDSRLL